MEDPLPSPVTQSEPNLQREFVPEQCLFCNKKSDEFESNIHHMQASHGLFIPDRAHLIVELKTLIEYIHLVIFGYNECICCGTQRNSAQAAQQHMVGKGHCRIDIADEESEFADFYDFSEAEEESQDESDEDAGSDATGSKRDKKLGKSVRPDENSIRLPSGKIISKSSSLQPHAQRPKTRSRSAEPQSHIEDAEAVTATRADQARSSTSLITRASKGGVALTKSERQENAFATQLARLSVNDRNSLAHLPASEQRAILATQQKQAEKTSRAQRRYQSRVEGLGNKTLMMHFRPDNPGGRANG
jgi:pre-60S factor REI1